MAWFRLTLDSCYYRTFHIGSANEAATTLPLGVATALGWGQHQLVPNLTKHSLESMKKELELIRQVLIQRSEPIQPTPTVANVSLSGSQILGNKDAPITLIEFSDYQCPYCSQFAQTTLPAIKADYIDTGKVRYVFRDYPLDQIHPYARKAAEAAHCAEDQGKYWEMHDALFKNREALQVEQLKAYARALGLDAVTFDHCLEQGKYASTVQKNYEDGIAAGVQGTPGFFLGKTRPEGTIQGLSIRGAQPVIAFRQAIDRLLGEP